MALGGPEDNGRSGKTECCPIKEVLGFVLSMLLVSEGGVGLGRTGRVASRLGGGTLFRVKSCRCVLW